MRPRGPRTGARSCSPTSTACASCAHPRRPSRRASAAASRVPAPPRGGPLRAEVAGRGAGRLVPRRPRTARALRAAGLGRGRRPPRGRHGGVANPPSAGLGYSARASTGNPSARDAALAPAALSRRRRGMISRSRAFPSRVRARRTRAANGGALPRAPGRPRVARLADGYAKARGVTRGAASPYQAVVALEAWLRTTRAYDEQASLPAEPGALARWAASGSAGYCQMFAASLAALARLSGVPARVVEGFAPGDLRDGVYHVTDRDAHAWVEAWFPGYGWLPFDATPGRALPARASSSSRRSTAPRRRRVRPSRRRRGLPRLHLPLARLRAAGAARARCARPRGLVARRAAARAGRRSRRCSRRCVLAKRALLRLALPRDPARRGARSACARSCRSGCRARAGAHAARVRRRARAALRRDAGAFAAALERAAYAPRERDDAPRGRDRRPAARAARCAGTRARRLRGAASRASAVRGRAR